MTTECNRVDANDLCPPPIPVTCVAEPPAWLAESWILKGNASDEEVRAYMEELHCQITYADVLEPFMHTLKDLGVEKMIFRLRPTRWNGHNLTPGFTVGYEHDPGPRKRKIYKRLALEGYQVTFQNAMDAVAEVIAHAVEEMGKLRAREARQAKKAGVTP